MAQGQTVIGVDWAVNLASLTKQMAQAPGITAEQAKKMTAELSKQMKAAEAAATKAAKASKDAWQKSAQGTDAAAASASKAAKAFGPLGGLLSRLDPTAGALSSSIAAGTSALEGFGVAAGPAGVAAGALAVLVAGGYVGWRAWNQEATHAAEVASLVSAAQEKLAPLVDATRIAEVKAAVATGQMTEEAGRLATEGVAAMKAFGSATADATAKIKELHAGEGSIGRELGDMADRLRSNPLYAGFTAAIDAVDAFTVSSSDAQDEIDALMAVEVEAAKITKDGVKANETAARSTLAKASADKAAALASRNRAEELALLVRRIDEENQANASAAAAAATANDIVTKSGAFRLTESQKLLEEEEAALADYAAAVWDSRLSAEQAAAGEAMIRANFQEQITEKEAEENKKRLKDAKDAAQKVVDANREAAERIMAIAGVGGEMESSLSASISTIMDNQIAAYDTTTAAGKAAAKKAWKVQHGLAIATAAIQGAIAEMGFISDGAQKGGIIGAALEGAAGAIVVGAGIAAVASTPAPSFHQGGLATDEAMLGRSKVQPGEGVGVVSKQGMSTFRGANAGIAPGPTNVSVELKLRHQTVDQVVAQNIQRGGQTARAIVKNGSSVPFGHRRDTWRR